MIELGSEGVNAKSLSMHTNQTSDPRNLSHNEIKQLTSNPNKNFQQQATALIQQTKISVWFSWIIGRICKPIVLLQIFRMFSAYIFSSQK